MIEVYINNKSSGIDAHGEYDPLTKQLTVKRGSKLSATITESPSFRGSSTIKMKREKYVVNGIVAEDATFQSSSTAANFVTGNSTNGLIAWRTADGISIKKLI